MYYYTYPYYQPQPMPMPVPVQPWSLVHSQRQYPPVDIEQFDESVTKFQKLMQQAHLLVDQLAENPGFAKELMSAAQESNKDKVDQLIKSAGVTINVETTFTPTGIQIILDNSKFAGDCCDLLIALRW